MVLKESLIEEYSIKYEFYLNKNLSVSR